MIEQHNRSSAVYLITGAAGNEWNLIETAIIIIVSLPVNLPSSMMSFSSWLQIDCIARRTNARTHAHTIILGTCLAYIKG